jgi:esterase/lipase superfamily enzyme
MRRQPRELYSPAIGGAATVVAYGHWGRPFLVFPTEQGSAWDYENNGMVSALSGLIDAGRLKLYCVDSYDGASWSDRSIPVEERARRHGDYESWIVDQVVPFVRDDCAAEVEIATTGCSLGAFQALNLAVKRADLFPLAVCLSGSYDPSSWHTWGERGDAAYFNNPFDYLQHSGGDHLDWLRSRLSVLLVVGQGQWEDTTGSLESTRAIARVLQAKGLRCELDEWGYDVPHDWPSWRAQIAHHLPRFC